MADHRAVMQQALGALELARLNGRSGLRSGELDEVFAAIKAIRTALAADKRAEGAEPVAWLVKDTLYGTPPGMLLTCDRHEAGSFPVYAHPPAKRVPLTEEQIVMDGLMMLPNEDAKDCAKSFTAGVRFAERAHGIKED
jgi:hypothetical protein